MDMSVLCTLTLLNHIMSLFTRRINTQCNLAANWRGYWEECWLKGYLLCKNSSFLLQILGVICSIGILLNFENGLSIYLSGRGRRKEIEGISSCKHFSVLKKLLCCLCKPTIGYHRTQGFYAEKRIMKKPQRCEIQQKAMFGMALLGETAEVNGSLIHESTAGPYHI